MVDEVGPAKLRYATDQEPETALPPTATTEPAVAEEKPDPAPPPTPADPVAEKPVPAAKEKPKHASPKMAGKGEKSPVPYHKISSLSTAKKGRDLVSKKKVSLKVEDLLKAGRSHFEIPKSKQKATKSQHRPRPTR